jgi:D-amino-acid dehydrogenase
VKVIVIGGGVVGTACAHALLEVADEVELLDAGIVGGGASAGNAGWVTPSLATPLAAPGILATGLRSALDRQGALVIRPRLDTAWVSWLWRFARASRPAAYHRGVKALLDLTIRSLDELDAMRADGVAFEEHRSGLLAVSRTRDGLHWFETLFAELVPLGFPGTIDSMGGDEARALEPGVSDAVGWATHAGLDRHVAPQTLVAGLAARLRERGATILEHTKATGLRRVGAGWAVDTPGDERRGDLVVLANALGAAALLEPIGLSVPIIGAKGYSVTVQVPDPTPVLPLYLCEVKIGTSPFVDGTRLAGFFELGATDDRPRAARARQLVDETRAYLRAPLPETIDDAGWAGFRPATPDSLPLLGPVASARGLIVATGHGMLGVTLAPATGRAVALLARGERPSWIEPLDPARFTR